MRRSRAASHFRGGEPARITAKIYGIMAVTTVLTFATLVAGHHLLFPPQQLFA
jgi:hypothetical protein